MKKFFFLTLVLLFSTTFSFACIPDNNYGCQFGDWILIKTQDSIQNNNYELYYNYQSLRSFTNTYTAQDYNGYGVLLSLTHASRDLKNSGRDISQIIDYIISVVKTNGNEMNPEFVDTLGNDLNIYLEAVPLLGDYSNSNDWTTYGDEIEITRKSYDVILNKDTSEDKLSSPPTSHSSGNSDTLTSTEGDGPSSIPSSGLSTDTSGQSTIQTPTINNNDFLTRLNQAIQKNSAANLKLRFSNPNLNANIKLKLKDGSIIPMGKFIEEDGLEETDRLDNLQPGVCKLEMRLVAPDIVIPPSEFGNYSDFAPGTTQNMDRNQLVTKEFIVAEKPAKEDFDFEILSPTTNNIFCVNNEGILQIPVVITARSSELVDFPDANPEKQFFFTITLGNRKLDSLKSNLLQDKTLPTFNYINPNPKEMKYFKGLLRLGGYSLPTEGQERINLAVQYYKEKKDGSGNIIETLEEAESSSFLIGGECDETYLNKLSNYLTANFNQEDLTSPINTFVYGNYDSSNGGNEETETIGELG